VLCVRALTSNVGGSSPTVPRVSPAHTMAGQLNFQLALRFATHGDNLKGAKIRCVKPRAYKRDAVHRAPALR
jgi:hypothetical protein